jgi:hypothetical protein
MTSKVWSTLNSPTIFSFLSTLQTLERVKENGKAIGVDKFRV